LIIILIVAGGVSYFKEVTFLQLKNMDHPKTVQIRVHPSETFSIFYVHSIYGVPVIEEFQVIEEALSLKGVRTKSPGVMEYYGFDDVKEFHPMDQKLGAIFIMRRGMGEGQGLIVRGQKIYLSEIGEKGDRIQLRVGSMPLGKYLYSRMFEKELWR
jgi:hypothetical protein